MKENEKRASSLGKLTLVKSPAVDKDWETKRKSAKNDYLDNKSYTQWENYHYSYAEFIHCYVEHINTLRRLKEHSNNSSGFLRLIKPMQ